MKIKTNIDKQTTITDLIFERKNLIAKAKKELASGKEPEYNGTVSEIKAIETKILRLHERERK